MVWFRSVTACQYSSGQTLIETIVAITILTTGIIGGLALAIQSLSSSSIVTKQIIATNLAREGIEAVRNIRDSNWLANSLQSCPYMGSGQQCIGQWANFGPASCNSSSSTNPNAGFLLLNKCANYRVSLNPSSGLISMENQAGGLFGWNANNYRLYLHPEGVYNHSAAGGQLTEYFRYVLVFRQELGIGAAQDFELLIVTYVWWQGRGCKLATGLANITDPQNACRVIVSEYLTNWK